MKRAVSLEGGRLTARFGMHAIGNGADQILLGRCCRGRLGNFRLFHMGHLGGLGWLSRGCRDSRYGQNGKSGDRGKQLHFHLELLHLRRGRIPSP